jgi:hypothetical protein
MLSFQRLGFDAMDHRTGFKRLYTAFTICWIGVCLIGGVAVSSVPGTTTPIVPGQAPPAGEWTGYTRDLVKGLTGSEYDAIRKSYFFRSFAGAVWAARRDISSISDDLVADAAQQEKPERAGFIARLMSTRKEDILAWLAVTIVPPIVVYILGFVAVPRIAGSLKSGE